MSTATESDWVTRRPVAPLAGLVDRYVGYRLPARPGVLHRGLPSRHLTFIVAIGGDIDVVAQTDPRQAPGRYRSVVSGLQASHALISQSGPQEGVAVELSPLGARALFGMPARALWNTTVDLADVAGPAGDELWERLQGTPGWAARFAVCDEVLLRIAREHLFDPALGRAWNLLVACRGSVPVADIAGRLGWSRQHFARRFAGEFGLAPKLASRVVRFERARSMLGAAPSVASVAVACGYFDQAHLNRDFRAFAGCSPGQWLTEELPSFQDKGLPPPPE